MRQIRQFMCAIIHLTIRVDIDARAQFRQAIFVTLSQLFRPIKTNYFVLQNIVKLHLLFNPEPYINAREKY